jgi:hypothetical protein
MSVDVNRNVVYDKFHVRDSLAAPSIPSIVVIIISELMLRDTLCVHESERASEFMTALEVSMCIIRLNTARVKTIKKPHRERERERGRESFFFIYFHFLSNFLGFVARRMNICSC